MQKQDGGNRPPQEARSNPQNVFKGPAQLKMFVGEIIKKRYHLHTLIGRGGMGEVYAAYDSNLGKDVAVKIIFGSAIENQDNKEIKRAMREASTTMSINNPHVIGMTDVSKFDGMVFCVMELLSGKDLEKILVTEKKPMEIERLVDLVEQICDGVQAAHDKHIMHRDLKPSNIFITRTPDGKENVKLLDFGIAKFVRGASALTTNSRQRDATKITTNTLIGTPFYMAPEQMTSTNYDHRVDIYSLGVIVYELATGAVPFNDELAFNILNMHVYKKPESPRIRRPDLPEHIERAILKAMEKNPRQRFQKAKDFADAIANRAPVPESNGAKRVTSEPPRVSEPTYRAVGEDMLQIGKRRARRIMQQAALATVLLAGAAAAYINRDSLVEKGTVLVEEVEKRAIEKKAPPEVPAPAPVKTDTYPISVHTTPEGAAIYEIGPGSDDEAYISKTPLDNHQVRKGEHNFVIKTAGCKNRRVSVTEAQSAVSVDLRSCKGVKRKPKAQDAGTSQQAESYEQAAEGENGIAAPGNEGYAAPQEGESPAAEQGAAENEQPQ